MQNKSTIVAIAWPDTKVVKEGKWYDKPMEWLGFIKNGYYTAGHAAFLLVNHTTNDIQYFDFGRYHTPYQFGRVRDQVTDPDVAVQRNAVIANGEIQNLEEILLDRYNNKSCHGEGMLTAVIVKDIDYAKAYTKVKDMQQREAIPYGPFQLDGSTCSRLVAKVVLASSNCWFTKLLIMVPYTVSATPRSNKKVLNSEPFYYEVVKGGVSQHKNKSYWFRKLMTGGTSDCLHQMDSAHIPKTA